MVPLLPEGSKGVKRRRVEQWVRKKRKVNTAEKLTRRTKGEPRSAKTLKASLSCRCQNRCASRVSVAKRKHIFDEFYKLADHDSQNKYLYGLIKRSVPIQRRPRSGAKVARSNSFQYLVRIWRFISIMNVLLGQYVLSALQNKGVSAFQGFRLYVKYIWDHADCPHFRDVRKARFHCTYYMYIDKVKKNSGQICSRVGIINNRT